MSLPFTFRWFSAGMSLALVVALASPGAQAADKEDSKSKSAKAAESEPADEVPEGSPKELLEYINKLQASQPKGSSRTARMESMRQILAKIIAAADKIIAAKADDETTAAALQAELEALSVQQRLGDADAGDKRDALLKDLKNDKRPAIAETAEFYQLVKDKEDLDASSPEDLRAFAVKAKDFLARARLQPRMKGLAIVTVQIVQQTDGALPAAKLAGELAVAFAKSDDPQVAANAAQFGTYAGSVYEKEEKLDEAAGIYEEIAKLLAKSDDEEIKASAEKLLAAVRKLKLIGNPLEIEGTLVDGKKFDWSKYKGKVVLVDFWATWCGPCIAELPNVKETYEKYHDRGFDVVGISLDDDEQALKEFLEAEQLPWPILFSSDPKATGWEHPMASYYGVSSIPATFLVGRDGKVVTLSARGEELGQLVAKLTGGEDEEKPAPKKSAKKGKSDND